MLCELPGTPLKNSSSLKTSIWETLILYIDENI